MVRLGKIALIITLLSAAIGCSAGPLINYDCHRASSPIKIDGKIDEPDWLRAEIVTFIVPVTNADAQSRTEAKVLWDDKYLYVSYKAFDKDVWSYLDKRDSSTCQEDCLECFIQPDPKAAPYMNFEINALGTVYDACALSRYAGGGDCHRWRRWNCKELKVGITVDGTRNNPSDVDNSWQMEVAIPFANLPPLNGRIPKVGDTWNILLARYDYSVYLPDGVELSSCSSLSKVSFHNADEWSHLVFMQ